MEKDSLITIKEAAAFLKTSKRHVRSMIALGKIQAKDISLGKGERKKFRIYKESLMKFVNEQTS